ncbi:MAG TPA: transporter substrate-binding domain-containing protein [Azospirillaceae bacterium]|nr:transporter substrate-binding domain-containing protein [Azospirillaceae bacterium]
MRFRLALAACLAAAGAQPSAAADTATLTILYQEMAPFIEKAPTGEVTGPVAERVAAVAAQAGVRLDWVGSIPRSRIIAEMEAGRPACLPNARKTPDREKLFKFSQPLFEAPDYRVVLKKERAQRYETLNDLLNDPELILGALLGVSLGPEIDAIIKDRGTNVLVTRGSMVDLVRLLHAGRIDYIILDELDYRIAAGQEGVPRAATVSRTFPDLPTTEPGRIMCARTVPDEVMSRLDRAIAGTRPS